MGPLGAAGAADAGGGGAVAAVAAARAVGGPVAAAAGVTGTPAVRCTSAAAGGDGGSVCPGVALGAAAAAALPLPLRRFGSMVWLLASRFQDRGVVGSAGLCRAGTPHGKVAGYVVRPFSTDEIAFVDPAYARRGAGAASILAAATVGRSVRDTANAAAIVLLVSGRHRGAASPRGFTDETRG